MREFLTLLFTAAGIIAAALLFTLAIVGAISLNPFNRPRKVIAPNLKDDPHA